MREMMAKKLDGRRFGECCLGERSFGVDIFMLSQSFFPLLILVIGKLECRHKRWHNLLFTADNTRQNRNTVIGCYVESPFKYLLSTGSVIKHFSNLALDVGKHVEDHRELFGLGSGFEEGSNQGFRGLAAVFGHKRTLANAKFRIAAAENLVITVEDFLGSAAGEVGTRIKHLL